MLHRLVLPFMDAGRSPVHEDQVPFGGHMLDLDLRVRRSLTCIGDDLFHRINPGALFVEARVVMKVIGEILMQDIEVPPHGFLESVLMVTSDKRLVFFHRHRTSSLLAWIIHEGVRTAREPCGTV